MKVNFFTFFREQLGRWKRENANRSEDYIQGGVTALREVSEKLTARKDGVDTDKLASLLAASEKENRYVQERNAKLNQQMREVTGKYEQLQRDFEVQRLDLADLRRSPVAVAVVGPPVRVAAGAAANRKQAEILAENVALRHRIKTLEGLLVADGRPTADPDSEVAALRGQVKTMRAQLDSHEGKARVGHHVFQPHKFIRRLREMLAWTHLPPELRFQFLVRHAETAQALLDGREPEEWLDKPDLSIYDQPVLANDR